MLLAGLEANLEALTVVCFFMVLLFVVFTQIDGKYFMYNKARNHQHERNKSLHRDSDFELY